MKNRARQHRWALWVFAAALLLKTAMPWLANLSADLQGKSLVEVCTVYGVSLVPLDGKVHGPASDHGSSHDDGHCALNAFAALATSTPPVIETSPDLARQAGPPRAHPSSQAPDACATWVARLKHGPPILS